MRISRPGSPDGALLFAAAAVHAMTILYRSCKWHTCLILRRRPTNRKPTWPPPSERWRHQVTSQTAKICDVTMRLRQEASSIAVKRGPIPQSVQHRARWAETLRVQARWRGSRVVFLLWLPSHESATLFSASHRVDWLQLFWIPLKEPRKTERHGSGLFQKKKK